MDNDYTPQDAGNSTHQVGDKYYKTPEEIEVLLSDSEKFEGEPTTEKKDEDQIPY